MTKAQQWLAKYKAFMDSMTAEAQMDEWGNWIFDDDSRFHLMEQAAYQDDPGTYAVVQGEDKGNDWTETLGL